MNKFIKAHKVVLFLLVIVVFLILSMVLVLISNRETTKIARENAKNEEKNSSARENPFNPLIGYQALKRVEDAYNKQYKNAGASPIEKPSYHFKYKLSPNLKKPTSFNLIPKIQAASNCSTELPATVPAYKLQSNLTTAEAVKEAAIFGYTSSPASIPTDDGISFQYYFAPSSASSYFAITQPSGTYQYHKAAKDMSGSSNLRDAESLAKDSIVKYKIEGDLSTTSSKQDASGLFSIHYKKNLDKYKMVDTLSLKSLGLSSSLCDTSDSLTMNYVEFLITKNDEIYKLINKTRTIKEIFTVATQTLENSIKEYEVNPPFPPIVLGDVRSGTDTVTVDEAIPVWYDYGDSYPQETYILMYLTSGRTPNNTRVLTLFPSSSEDELKKKPDLLPSNNVLQLGSFTPPPAKSPAGPGTGLCWGNQVDYTVSCTSGGTTICSNFYGLPSGENDPFDVCKKGCQNRQETFTPKENKNPCEEALEKNGMKPNASNPIFSPGVSRDGVQQQINTSGEVVCTINGCPC